MHGLAGQLSGVPVGLGARALAEHIPQAWSETAKQG
jgi:hypothetical protein